MKLKQLLSAMMLASLFASCISTIEIDTVPVNKILVVGSLISPDTVFWCNVSKVYAVNDSNNHYIDNATVKIFDNTSNALVCELNYDSAGIYRAANVYPEEGKEYRLEVSSDGFPSVTGVTQVPPRQEAESVSIIEEAGFEALLNDDYSELRWTINDKFETPNYYEVLFSGFRSSNTDWLMNGNGILNDSVYNIEDANYFSQYTIVDAVLNAENLMQYNPSTLVFSDNLFNMQQHSFVARCGLLSATSYAFQLFALNTDLYKFRTTLMQHLYERGAKGISRFDDLAGLDFSSKAIDVFSNLTGGYGIFAAYNRQILFTKLVTVKKVAGGNEYFMQVSDCDTLADGRILTFIDQTTNPYEN